MFPKKRRITFDKGRGILEVKKSLLVPAKVTVVSWPELIGVGYVRTVIGEKRVFLLTKFFYVLYYLYRMRIFPFVARVHTACMAYSLRFSLKRGDAIYIRMYPT